MSHFLVCYDLSDTRERTQVEKRVARYALRVQKSVFWCAFTSPIQHLALEAGLRELNLQSGAVLLIPASGWHEVTQIGVDVPVELGQAVWLAV